MRKAALAAVALGIAALAFPGRADAHIHKQRTRIDGNTAVATWNYQNGDIATFVSVVVTDQDVVDNGSSSGDRFATVSILQSNVVTGNVLVAGVADLSDFTFDVDHNLKRARLRATGLFEDDSTLTFLPFSVDLQWTATGGPERQSSHDLFKEPGFIVKTRFHGVSRDAAVTGSIVAGTTEYVGAAPESAEIQRNDSGTVTITITKCGQP
jgi:hypothetical protein